MKTSIILMLALTIASFVAPSLKINPEYTAAAKRERAIMFANGRDIANKGGDIASARKIDDPEMRQVWKDGFRSSK